MSDFERNFLTCDHVECDDPVALARGGYCVRHGEPPEPPTCKADGCDNDARTLFDGYCSQPCENKGLREAVERLEEHGLV